MHNSSTVLTIDSACGVQGNFCLTLMLRELKMSSLKADAGISLSPRTSTRVQNFRSTPEVPA
jgi:hypothetical protein